MRKLVFGSSLVLLLAACDQPKEPLAQVQVENSRGANESKAPPTVLPSVSASASGKAEVDLCYKCNDPFDMNKLPSIKPALKKLLAETNFAALAVPKALAMSEDGYGYPGLVDPTGIVSLPIAKAEARRIALEACSALSGKACKIVAVGNLFCPDGPEEYKALGIPQSFDDIPFVFENTKAASDWRKKIKEDYPNSTAFKAIAISIDGFGWMDNVVDSVTLAPFTYARTSDEEAARIALEFCEINARMPPCTLYAVGNKIVFDPAKINRSPIIDYKKTTLTKPLLGVGDRAYDALWFELFPRGDVNRFTDSVYMDLDGNPFFNADDAMAKATCEDGGKYVCFKLAQGNKLTFTSDILWASKYPDVTCGSIPRSSCEAHNLLGCKTSGNYLIFKEGKVVEELCTF